MATAGLFAPLQIGPLWLRNRIAMAPMTREMASEGVPSPAMKRYYERRAKGGVALVIGEGATVDVCGRFSTAVPHFSGDRALAVWADIVAAVHAEGAAFFPQLWHVGAFSPTMVDMGQDDSGEPPRLSPSGLAAPGRPHGRAMAPADIDATIAAFAAAAAAAYRMGCDGVEVHAAHGYLPDQFLWTGTNARDDRYGSSIAGRTRFAAELVCAIKQETAPQFPVSLRISQWKQLDYGARIATDPAELAAMVEPLTNAGVDIFHCSTRRFWEAEFVGDPRNLSGWVRALSGRPTITVGSVTLGVDFKAAGGKAHAASSPEHIALLEAGLARGDYDMVAIGRALLANPDWANLVAAGRADTLRAFDRAVLMTLD